MKYNNMQCKNNINIYITTLVFYKKYDKFILKCIRYITVKLRLPKKNTKVKTNTRMSNYK